MVKKGDEGASSVVSFAHFDTALRLTVFLSIWQASSPTPVIDLTDIDLSSTDNKPKELMTIVDSKIPGEVMGMWKPAGRRRKHSMQKITPERCMGST